jgi:hypothetical protein
VTARRDGTPNDEDKGHTIAALQQAIISLPKSDYSQLRRWLYEYD